MIKRSTILLTLLLLLLTACGSETAPATTSAAATTTSAAATATVATAPPLPTSTAQPTNEPTAEPSPTPPSAATTVAQTGTAAASGVQEQATIKLFMFKPNPLNVKAGTTIEWTNEDAIEHSVTAGTPSQPSNSFDSGFFTQGQTFAFTFAQPGDYTYFCKRHESMTGTITVTAP